VCRREYYLSTPRLPDTDQAAELERIMRAGAKFVVITHARKIMDCERADRTAIVDRHPSRSYSLAATVTGNGDAVDIYTK